MATTKPRLTISLDPVTYQTFTRFAELSAKPTATIISDLLRDARPHFEQLGVLLQQAHQLKENGTEEARKKFAALLDVGAHRATAANEYIQSDLVTAVDRGAARPRSGRPPSPAIRTKKSTPAVKAATKKK
jgi:hypothetical protein